MDSLFNYISRYSTPVVFIFGIIFLAGYVVMFFVERKMESAIEHQSKIMEYTMLRQSNFHGKIMWQKYEVLTELNSTLSRLRSEVNGYILGRTKTPHYMRENDFYELTDAFETINTYRFLIGEDFHQLMREHASTLIKFHQLHRFKDKTYQAEQQKQCLETKLKNSPRSDLDCENIDKTRYKELSATFLEIDKQFRTRMRLAFDISEIATQIN